MKNINQGTVTSKMSFLSINTHMHTQSSVQQLTAMARNATDHIKQQTKESAANRCQQSWRM